MRTILFIYLAGVALGLWRVDAAPAGKVMLALGWPVGLAAAAVVLVLLSGAAVLLFPVFGAAVVAAATLAWMLW